MHSPFFIGSGLYLSVEHRLRKYIKANNLQRISYILWTLANTYYVSFQSDIYEESFASIMVLMNSSRDFAHPQYLSILIDYYLKGGKLSLRDNFPSLAQTLPAVDLSAAENYGSTAKNIKSEQTLSNKLEEKPFTVAYMSYISSLQLHSLASLLLFQTAINQRRYSVPSFEFFLEKKHKMASSLAIRCYNLPSLYRFVGSERLNAKRATENIKKLEVAHRLLLELLDGIEVEVDNNIGKVNTKNKDDQGNDSKLFKTETFQPRLLTLETNDYCESFTLYQFLVAMSKSGVGELFVSSMISVVLNAGIKELMMYTEGHSPLLVQTVFVLYKVARMVKLVNFQEDLVKITLSIKKFPNELERIMHWKLLNSIFARQSPTQLDNLTNDKFGKTLFYSSDHLPEARDAMRESWIRFRLLCSNLSSEMDLSDILSDFDSSSVFHSKNHFQPIQSRFIAVPPHNMFLKDILVTTENLVVDLVTKLTGHLLSRKFLGIGLYNKSIIVMMQSALRRSLSSLRSHRSRP